MQFICAVYLHFFTVIYIQELIIKFWYISLGGDRSYKSYH